MEKQITQIKKELEKFISINLDLEKKLIYAETKNKKNEIKLKASIEKNVFLEKMISSRDNEIKNLKADLEKSKKQIEIDKKNFSNTISDKNKEIEDLKNNMRIKISQIDELYSNSKSLKAQIPEKEATPDLIEKIKDIMKFKGFISEKEFEELIGKKEKN